jgi:hypothetical protein
VSASRAPIHQAQRAGEEVARSRTLEWLARAGLVARGVIYAIIGILAIKLALGDGGKTTNQNGALDTIARQPFGKVLLIIVAVGLGGYSLWRLVRAAIGHGSEASDDTKDRIAAFGSGVAYGVLFVAAVSILIGSGGGSGSPDKATGGVLDWPGGPVLVALAGLIMVGVGLEQGYEALTVRFLDRSKTWEMSERVQQSFTALGVFGYLARMVVFVLVGYFLFRAGLDHNADKAVSLDGALTAVGEASYGPVLLGVVAAGLIGFAAYSIADARYRKV